MKEREKDQVVGVREESMKRCEREEVVIQRVYEREDLEIQRVFERENIEIQRVYERE